MDARRIENSLSHTLDARRRSRRRGERLVSREELQGVLVDVPRDVSPARARERVSLSSLVHISVALSFAAYVESRGQGEANSRLSLRERKKKRKKERKNTRPLYEHRSGRGTLGVAARRQGPRRFLGVGLLASRVRYPSAFVRVSRLIINFRATRLVDRRDRTILRKRANICAQHRGLSRNTRVAIKRRL